MGDVKWIKITTNIFDDEKIKLIESMPNGDSFLVVWFKLLVQAGKCNADGLLQVTDGIPYTPEMLSILFNRPLDLIKKALDVFFKFELLEIQNSNVTCVTNWEKHQNIEALDVIREQARDRQKRYRSRKTSPKDSLGDVAVTLRNGIDIDKDIEYINNNNKGNAEKDIQSVNDFPCYNVFSDTVLNINRKAGKIIMEDNLKVFKKYFCNYIPVTLHNQEFIETWLEWVDYRISTKHPLQVSTAKRQLKKLSNWNNPIGVLEQSILNGWTGLFEIKENGNGAYRKNDNKKCFTGIDERNKVLYLDVPTGFSTLDGIND